MYTIERVETVVYRVGNIQFDSLDLAEAYIRKQEEIDKRAAYLIARSEYLNWMSDQLRASERCWCREDCYDWMVENFTSIAARFGYRVERL